ncbi:MAG: DUF3276 family protein [candidate division Zixibacteria bacterium]|nr:DUF3276 family protein [candidate division Zixibacteria bacterium]
MESERRQLFSERLLTKGRSYFFDVKLSAPGNAYLIISESRKVEGGKYEHTRVMVFENDIKEFRDALRKALEYIETRPGKQTAT